MNKLNLIAVYLLCYVLTAACTDDAWSSQTAGSGTLARMESRLITATVTPQSTLVPSATVRPQPTPTSTLVALPPPPPVPPVVAPAPIEPSHPNPPVLPLQAPPFDRRYDAVVALISPLDATVGATRTVRLEVQCAGAINVQTPGGSVIRTMMPSSLGAALSVDGADVQLVDFERKRFGVLCPVTWAWQVEFKTAGLQRATAYIYAYETETSVPAQVATKGLSVSVAERPVPTAPPVAPQPEARQLSERVPDYTVEVASTITATALIAVVGLLMKFARPALRARLSRPGAGATDHTTAPPEPAPSADEPALQGPPALSAQPPVDDAGEPPATNLPRPT